MFIQEIELDSSRLLRNEIKKWHVVLNLSGILKSSFLKYLRHLQKNISESRRRNKWNINLIDLMTAFLEQECEFCDFLGTINVCLTNFIFLLK